MSWLARRGKWEGGVQVVRLYRRFMCTVPGWETELKDLGVDGPTTYLKQVEGSLESLRGCGKTSVEKWTEVLPRLSVEELRSLETQFATDAGFAASRLRIMDQLDPAEEENIRDRFEQVWRNPLVLQELAGALARGKHLSRVQQLCLQFKPELPAVKALVIGTVNTLRAVKPEVAQKFANWVFSRARMTMPSEVAVLLICSAQNQSDAWIQWFHSEKTPQTLLALINAKVALGAFAKLDQAVKMTIANEEVHPPPKGFSVFDLQPLCLRLIDLSMRKDSSFELSVGVVFEKTLHSREMFQGLLEHLLWRVSQTTKNQDGVLREALESVASSLAKFTGPKNELAQLVNDMLDGVERQGKLVDGIEALLMQGIPLPVERMESYSILRVREGRSIRGTVASVELMLQSKKTISSVVWNWLLEHVAAEGSAEDAADVRRLISKMDDLELGQNVIHALAEADIRAGNLNGVLSSLNLGRDRGIETPRRTYTELIWMLCKKDDLDFVDEVAQLMEGEGLAMGQTELEIVACTHLKHGRVSQALEKMAEINEFSSSGESDPRISAMMVSQLVEHGELNWAMTVFERMIRDGVQAKAPPYQELVLEPLLNALRKQGREEDALRLTSSVEATKGDAGAATRVTPDDHRQRIHVSREKGSGLAANHDENVHEEEEEDEEEAHRASMNSLVGEVIENSLPEEKGNALQGTDLEQYMEGLSVADQVSETGNGMLPSSIWQRPEKLALFRGTRFPILANVNVQMAKKVRARLAHREPAPGTLTEYMTTAMSHSLYDDAACVLREVIYRGLKVDADMVTKARELKDKHFFSETNRLMVRRFLEVNERMTVLKNLQLPSLDELEMDSFSGAEDNRDHGQIPLNSTPAFLLPETSANEQTAGGYAEDETDSMYRPEDQQRRRAADS